MGHMKFLRFIKWIVFGATLTSAAAAAQDLDSEAMCKMDSLFGGDTKIFQDHFSSLLKRKAVPIQTSSTIDEFADQVSIIHVFLTGEPNEVIGEVAISGKTRLREIALTIDNKPIRFVDTGVSPDRKPGDGIFTARFRTDLKEAWESLRQDLRTSAQFMSAPKQARYVRRGPRNIVPARVALEELRSSAPSTFKGAVSEAGRTKELAGFTDPIVAAQQLHIDIKTVPLLTIPGPAFDPKDKSRFERVFDIPVIEFFPIPQPIITIDESRSLMVVDTGVVEDSTRTFDACTGQGTPGGPWTFGHLMRELSFGTGMTPEDFVMHWLSTWIMPQEANGWIVDEPGRATSLQSQVIDSWQRLSGPSLDIDKFPARLLAIVNRPDLADRIGYGSAGSAGESRFVFGLLEKTAVGSCISRPFTIIFEYGIAGGSCQAVKDWHKRWKDLDAHTVGSPDYNAAMEMITRDFTDHGSNPSQMPNQSSLNQLRTNENTLDPTWQLREFHLQGPGGSVPPGLLDLVTVKQTPDDGFRNGISGTPTIAAYLVANETDILANHHVVPERFPGIFDRFLGAKTNVPFPPTGSSGIFWNAPNLTSLGLTDAAETRRKFSLATCNACHGGETETFFTHIGSAGTRNPGSPASLSGFLTGIDVTVPVTGGIHHYADLAEREAAMRKILTKPCFGLLDFRKIPFVH